MNSNSYQKVYQFICNESDTLNTYEFVSDELLHKEVKCLNTGFVILNELIDKSEFMKDLKYYFKVFEKNKINKICKHKRNI